MQYNKVISKFKKGERLTDLEIIVLCSKPLSLNDIRLIVLRREISVDDLVDIIGVNKSYISNRSLANKMYANIAQMEMFYYYFQFLLIATQKLKLQKNIKYYLSSKTEDGIIRKRYLYSVTGIKLLIAELNKWS